MQFPLHSKKCLYVWRAFSLFVLLRLAAASFTQAAEKPRYAETHSRSQYVHWIHLYDADNVEIDAADPNVKPYSPRQTCGRCHDYDAIIKGHHFNAMDRQVNSGRPGEPWIWTDDRTGTQIPLSYRGWKGTYQPKELNITPRDFLLKFGRHLPGGGAGEPDLTLAEPQDPTAEADRKEESDDATSSGEAADDVAAAGESEVDEEHAAKAPDPNARWRLSGLLEIDCMICHSNSFDYSLEARWQQIEAENFAWAPTAALGIGHVEGMVSRLPDDFDPEAAGPDSPQTLPKTTYGTMKSNGEGKIFVDVILEPRNNACYFCHSNRSLADGGQAAWNHDEDVHVKAGMACADCHRNGIEHHTVRGYEREVHPTGESVATLSCRGCHMDGETSGGRLGAPKPLHKGLPPLHLAKMSCTACHSGPLPDDEASQVQTAMAHGLGLPSRDYGPANLPGMVTPVFLQDDEVLYPHRMFWPAFWGAERDGTVTPLNPEAVYDAIRRPLRIRRGQSFSETMSNVRLTSDEKKELLGEERFQAPDEELTDEEKKKMANREHQKAVEQWQEKLAAALEALREIVPSEEARPVYVSGGKAFKLSADGKVESFDTSAAQPYAWPLAHNVRPARWSLGATGCFECHRDGAALFEGNVTALGPAPASAPLTVPMYALSGYDEQKLDVWAQSFQGRTAFKYFGFAAMGVVGLILFAYLVAGINGLFGRLFNRSRH